MKTMAMLFGCALAVCAQDSEQMQAAARQKLEAAKAAMLEAGGAMPQTFTFIGGQIFNGNPVKGQPYSAEAVNETTQTLADGNKIVTRSSTMIYRDSDGRERREETIGKLGPLNAANGPAKVVFISDPVAKVSYTLHSSDHTAERMPPPMAIGLGKAAAGFSVSTQTVTTGDRTVIVRGQVEPITVAPTIEPGGRGRPEKNAKVEQLGTQAIEGIPAEGTRTTITIPAGEIGNERDINIVSERWYSQELGVVVMSKRSDPRTGDTVYKLTNVNRTEPPHSLFEVPPDYTVFDGGSPKVRVRQEEQ